MSTELQVQSVTIERRVPVIILNWNGWDDTLNCLRSVASLREAENVWLVDNHSIDDRTEEAKVICPSLRIFRWNDNYGWAGGNNRALKIAASEGYVFAYLLNNDTTVEPGFLLASLAVASNDTSFAAVSSRIAYASPTGFVLFDGQYYPPGSQPLIRLSGHRQVSHVNGAGLLIRITALESVGYFDERYFCYCEDTEWSIRVRDRGWKLAIANESLVTHTNQSSDIKGNAIYYSVRNQTLLFERLPVPQRWLRELQAAYRNVRSASLARRNARPEEAQAIASGMWDGFTRRFGKRNREAPAVAVFVLSRCWVIPPIFLRRRLTLLFDSVLSLVRSWS